MMKFNIRETREQLSHLLDAVAAGEEVIVTRRGRVAARLVRAEGDGIRFPDRSALRDALPPMQERASETVRALRDEARY